MIMADFYLIGIHREVFESFNCDRDKKNFES